MSYSKTQKEWLESECPRCFKCGNRFTQGRIFQFKPICLTCWDILVGEAAINYLKLPRNEKGKIIAKKL